MSAIYRQSQDLSRLKKVLMLYKPIDSDCYEKLHQFPGPGRLLSVATTCPWILPH